MNIQYEYNQKLDVILVICEGMFRGSRENSLFLKGNMALSERFNCFRFLIDARNLKLDQTLVDAPYLANNFYELGFDIMYRTAFLYAHDENLYKFLELILEDRGYQARFFDNESDARTWL